MDWWVRLPLYLQRAGRMSEAAVEFDWLIEDTIPRVIEDYQGATDERLAEASHRRFHAIYEAMRIAWEREGDADKALAAETRAKEHLQAATNYLT